MKTFRLEHAEIGGWSAVVEIDDESPYTQRTIVAMVEFWSGHERRLKLHDYDYTRVFLQQLARKLFYMSIDDNLACILRQFDEGIEGWCPMNGKNGIRILRVDQFVIEDDDFLFMTV